MNKFNFDHWKTLYEADPTEFERQRVRTLQRAAVKLFPDEPEKAARAMATVNGWDMRLNRIKNQTSRIVMLQRMFTEQLLKFDETLKPFRSTR